MLELLAGFALGLGGSLHCVGMCGPIAIALPSAGKSGHTRAVGAGKDALHHAVPKMVYQLGRVVTYTLLGAIVGLGGSAIALTGYSRMLSIASGIAMIVALLLQLVWNRQLISGTIVERWIAPLKRGLSRLLSSHGMLTHFGIGLLNGLLPCGLVTAALLGSLGTGSIVSGTLFMFGFGMGTVPLMSVVAIGGSRFSCQLRKRLRYAAPAISMVIATLFLLRGMALGIPHVSPRAVTTPTTVDCCR